MKDNIFSVQDDAFLCIKDSPQNMTEYFEGLSEEEFNDIFKICSRTVDDLSSIEVQHLIRISICLFCLELDVREIPSKAIDEILDKFIINVILEKGRREGHYKISGPITLVKDFKIKMTKKGKLHAQSLIGGILTNLAKE